MSLKALSWAMEQDIKPLQKVILMTLAVFQNDETGLCCPSRKRLAKLVGISEATLKRQLSRMEVAGWIVRRARFSPKSKLQTSNVYIINFKNGRRLNMSPLPQYDDIEIQAAQNEPAANPGGATVEPPPGSHVEPPSSLKENLKKEGASGASENLSPEEAPPAAASCPPPDPETAYISDDRGWKRLEMSANPHGKGWLPNWGALPHDAECTTPPDVIQRYERKFGRWKEKGGYGRGIEPPTASKQSWQQAGNSTIN